MSLELVIRPEAEADALEAYQWYSEQLPGLGDDFLAEIDRALESISAVRGDRIVVFAILHTARDPRLWRKRGRNAR
jgi:toxin ParE1/3/4